MTRRYLERWGQTGSSPFSRTTNQYLLNEIVQINIRKRPVCPLGSVPLVLPLVPLVPNIRMRRDSGTIAKAARRTSARKEDDCSGKVS